MVKEEKFDFEANTLRAKKSDLPLWYSQVVTAADLIDDRFDIKGAAVWKPYGYKVMMNLKQFWDNLFQGTGIEEMYFPLIVPISYAEQNESWWAGFKTEGYKVIAGSDNKVQGILRPTGEPAMYPMFALWIREHNTLPLRIYQTVNSYRYETKQTKPLIRTREITVWHEIHTAHASMEDANKEMDLHMEFYDTIFNWCALPAFKVKKPIWECFPGAVGAVEYYTTTPEARVMENGSVNNLGQAYAKKFNIKFKDASGKEQHVWQLCTGNGARLLGGIIIVHGDDHGLVLPPNIAPLKVVIVPIWKKGEEKEVLAEARKVLKSFSDEGIVAKLDDRNITPGKKFYEYEIKGVPIRVEIGPKDIQNKSVVMVRRDTLEKYNVLMSKAAGEVKQMLVSMQKDMLKRAQDMLDTQFSDAANIADIKKNLANKKISRLPWCDSRECYDKVGAIEEGLEGFGSDMEAIKECPCAICSKPAKTLLYAAKTY
ncbi:MAG TPA: aminoacyl--tRNA ligase-related protein [Candidatus Nanoarchaeia archaeon]|nr:aminoacyl--tRNA ligase-related protein [Candidatus Nanoarchaeia archaeon]